MTCDAGIATRRLYEDRASGRLDAAVKALRRGGTSIVWKPERLGRDLRHLINVIHDLSMRSIGFEAVSGSDFFLAVRFTRRF
jgi:DNA invertase Pin-like site-specific DNA recombinase